MASRPDHGKQTKQVQSGAVARARPINCQLAQCLPRPMADEPSEEALTPDCPRRRGIGSDLPVSAAAQRRPEPGGVVKEGVRAKVQEFLIYQPKT
jgi:hypothetical protein